MDEWTRYIVLSVASFVFFLLIGFIQQKKRSQKHTSFHYDFRFHYWLVLGVFFSAVFLLFPVQLYKLSDKKLYTLSDEGLYTFTFHKILSSLVYSWQLFTVNADYNEILSKIPYPSECIGKIHSVLLTIVFFTAPILTLTVVLSLFRNYWAKLVFRWKRIRNTYVFSDLNEQSLALARSIRSSKKWACLAFAGVKKDDEEETQASLIRGAEEIHGICLKNDILSFGFKYRKFFIFGRLYIYLISNNESENIVQAVTLKEQLNGRKKCRIYVFSTRPECEYLIAESKKSQEKKAVPETTETPNPNKASESVESQESEKAKITRICQKIEEAQQQEDARKADEPQKNDDDRFLIRKINPILSLVYRNLYDDGYKLLFEHTSNESSQKISVILVGLGQYGLEMLKALPWFCQMYGYEFEINAFDKDKNARKKVEAACPELFIFKAQDILQKAVPIYNIHIHPDTDTDSVDFSNALINIENPTYILVALGEDAQNIRTAINIRILFEQNSQIHIHPKIQTIVYNSEECNVLNQNDSFNEEQNHFDINFIGDMNSSCKEDVLINSELEKDGKSIHREYSPTQIESFYTSDYNYRSSCASAIHTRAVASFLKDYPISKHDQKLLEAIESWLNISFRFSETNQDHIPKAYTSSEGSINEKLIPGASRITEFVKNLTAMDDFSFPVWIEAIKELKHPSNQAPNNPIYTIVMETSKKQPIPSFDSTNSSKETEYSIKHNTKYCIKHDIIWIEDKNKNLHKKNRPDFIPANDSDDQSSCEKNKEDLYIPEEIFAYIILLMNLMKLEHERWCAYMRTEGFRHNKDKNTAFKMHPDLVSYDELPDREKPKDLHLNLLICQKRKIRKSQLLLREKKRKQLESNCKYHR